MSGYGYWPVVAVNSLVFIIFALSFTRPRTGRDWRACGAFSAFIVALFTEMYGFPLTIYFLSGWLGRRYPGLDPFSHNAGHLWYTVFGLSGDPHLMLVHEISNWLILGGLAVVAVSWLYLYRAQRRGVLAVTGPYAFIRHPQYVGFLAVIFGFLLQWPTVLTLIMFPFLVRMYIWLARQEEREALDQFGEAYTRYAAATPGFLPRPFSVWRRGK